MKNIDRLKKRLYKLQRYISKKGEVPIVAILFFPEKKRFFIEYNRTKEIPSGIAHAELLVIEKAIKRLKTERIPTGELFVTLEPCHMCFGAISLSRIRKLVFFSLDKRYGGYRTYKRLWEERRINHFPEVYIYEDRSISRRLKAFFRYIREKK